MECVVRIMQGVQGSGKSTYVKTHFPNASVCSADHFFVQNDGEYVHDAKKLKEAHGFCLKRFVVLLQSGCRDIVVDNTNIMRWEQSTYVQLAKAYDRQVEIHSFPVDPKVAFGRNSHNVPWDTVLRSSLFMESPLATWGRHFIHLPDGTCWSNDLSDPEPDASE
jgi:predicted kinase